MKYSVAIKHFKRIIDKKAVKDALRGVYHKDNTMTGTDSKRLLYCEVEKKTLNQVSSILIKTRQ
ncbi:TPA: hypothetical protein OW056_002728 [Staphylococcus aureus]|nr:hypothetical protein [Staphylococcus aureus]HCW0039250.1 hypothetical protein [Staphylococcus aureus]